MAIIMPPEYPPMRADHPDKPEQGEGEDYVEYIGRCATFWTEHPPAPPEGFELVPCEAEPRHWPEYRPVDNTFYPSPCMACQLDATSKSESELRCRLTHRRWKSWGVLGWLGQKGYATGVVASTGVSYGRCAHCGIGRQYMRPRWRGRRVYILGKRTDDWRCLLKYHHVATEDPGIGIPCTKCLPCADCGSTDVGHRCEAIA